MRRLVVLATALAMCAGAAADYSSTFEPPTYTGSPTGTILAGQDGWYNPVSGSAAYTVYTYAGNTYSIAPNPSGGYQFAGGRHEGQAAFARAQHDHQFYAGDVWQVTYDVCVKYTGTANAENNIGSFSLQPSASATYWQSLFQWTDPNTPNPASWKSLYVTQEYPSGNPVSPGPAWRNLVVNRWYRESTVFRLSDRLILAVSIADLTTGQTTCLNNPGWHLLNPQGSTPTAFRFFTGGGSGTTPAGNFVAWDNLSIAPVYTGACCLPNHTCVANVLPADCTAQSGVFQGPGTCCEPNPCVSGACCLPSGLCLQKSPAACGALNGSYMGDNVPCTPGLCPVAPDCGPGTLFSQVVIPPSGNWYFLTSDSYYPYIVYDNYQVGAPVCDLQWWGFDLMYTGTEWIECD